MKKLLLTMALVFSTVVGVRAQCGPGEDMEAPVFASVGEGTQANPFVNLEKGTVGSVASGVYYFDFDGTTFQGYLDNDTDGGGWLLILNYVHKAGTNPALDIRALGDDLPLPNAGVALGDDESGTTAWGHAGNALAAKIDFEEMRFSGETSKEHGRKIHFITDYANVLSYTKTGTGSFSGINNAANYTLLADHTANIPQNAVNVFVNKGDEALTQFPFWKSGTYHWGITPQFTRWEVDDVAINTANTMHQVWVRGDASPAGGGGTHTAQLDAAGNATIAASDFNVVPTDNCSTVFTYSLSETNFTCADVGNSTIQLTATDEQGNTASTDVVVIVEDKIAPTITLDNSVSTTITLDENETASISIASLNITAADNCEVASLTLSKTAFTCSDVIGGGSIEVTVTATDTAGNVATETINFTVVETEAPVAVSVADFDITLGDDGTENINFTDIDNGSSDNCSVVSREIDKSSFTCADVGPNVITLTVTDASGNTDTATTTVNVIGNSTLNFPYLGTSESNTITVQLGNDDMVTVAASDFNLTAVSGCGGTVTGQSLSKTEFTCADLGSNTIQITATDDQSGSITEDVIVVVEDKNAPVLTCSVTDKNETIALDATGFTVPDYITLENITATDGCTSSVTITQSPAIGETLPSGEHAITITATDDAGNTDTCQFNITIAYDIASQTPSVDNTSGVCEVEATVSLGGSEADVTYYLRDDADNTVIETKAGTGSSLSFAKETLSTDKTYNVYAQPTIADTEVFKFNETNGYITLPGSLGTTIPNNAITFETWAHITDVDDTDQYSCLFSHVFNNRSIRLMVGIINGKLVAGHYDSRSWQWTSQITYPKDEWIHIAATYDTTNIKIYINGVEVASVASTRLMDISNTGVWYLGKRWDGNAAQNITFGGAMARTRVWNTVRTASEITANMNTTITSETGLVAAYNYGDGGTTITDATGNGHDGTLNNQTDSEANSLDLLIGGTEFSTKPSVTIEDVADQTVSLSQSGNDVTVSIDNSQTGVSYVLRNDADDSIIETKIGTGANVDFAIDAITANKTYNVYAEKSTCNLQLTNTPEATFVESIVKISPKVFLLGAGLNPNTGEENLMRDDLRVASVIPTTTPYTDGATLNPSVLTITGTTAVVDWVYVELRDKNDKESIIDGASALLLRNGDVVAVDGTSTVEFSQVSNDYYVVVKHRNHLALITTDVQTLSSTTTVIDFTNSASSAQGATNALSLLANGKYAMYAGDYDDNGQVQNNDAISVRAEAGISGYEKADMDMNGQVQNTDATNIALPCTGKGQQF